VTQLSPVFFYLFAGMAIAFAVMTVLNRNPVSSAFSLVMVFFSFAGIYAMLDAHLIAALQVLVYAGAVMVLFIFVIMLLGADRPSFDLGRSHVGLRVASFALCALLFGVFVVALKESALTGVMGPHTPEKIAEAGGNTKALSQLLFSDYILPFELTSVLLLVGIVGAVAIAKRKLGPKGTN
jgi:NADH-quinone oxidoreductase subunit J